MNYYSYEFEVKCPNGEEYRRYHLTIECKETIMCEDIVATCNMEMALYHENIADKIRLTLPGDQTIKAIHCGVVVKTVR